MVVGRACNKEVVSLHRPEQSHPIPTTKRNRTKRKPFHSLNKARGKKSGKRSAREKGPPFLRNPNFNNPHLNSIRLQQFHHLFKPRLKVPLPRPDKEHARLAVVAVLRLALRVQPGRESREPQPVLGALPNGRFRHVCEDAVKQFQPNRR